MPKFNLLDNLHTYTLPNGLNLWVKSRSDTPSVVAGIHFPVGARHDPPKLLGISHFVEHTLFSTNRRWSETVLYRQIESRGGMLNAETGPEHTFYYLRVNANYLASALDVLVDLAFHPTFEAGSVQRERKVIMNEMGMQHLPMNNRIVRWARQIGLLGYTPPASLDTHWQGESTLANPAIGWPKTVKRTRPQDLANWHQQHYLPNNATLIVVGNCQPDSVLRMATALTEHLPAGPLPPPSPPLKATPRPKRRWQAGLALAQYEIYVTAALPGASHPDIPAITILGIVLQKRLTEAVRLSQGLTYYIGANGVTWRDVGVFEIGAMVDHRRHFLPLWRAIQRELSALRRGALTDREVAAAKRRFGNGVTSRLDSNRDQFWQLAQMAIDNGQPVDWVAQHQAVTRADVLRVLNTYLRPEHFTLHLALFSALRWAQVVLVFCLLALLFLLPQLILLMVSETDNVMAYKPLIDLLLHSGGVGR